MGVIVVNRFLKVILILSVVFVLMVLIGFFIEGFKHNAMDQYNPPGDFVEYEESDIHYIKKGSGDQTVVFGSGNGTTSPYADMFYLQNEISADAETITYERPGYGWSDSTDRPRTIDAMTNEIEAVLNAASDHESFVFVGHSMAALEIFSYAHKHPKKVDGIVLIDGVYPEYASEMDASIPVSIHLTKFMKNAGLIRLMSNFTFFQDQLIQEEDLSDEVKEATMALTLDRMWNDTMFQEREMISDNGNQVRDKGNIGDIPLTIFSASDNQMEGWKASQEKLPEMSTQSKQIWIDTDNHFVHHEESDLVVKKIQELLESTK